MSQLLPFANYSPARYAALQAVLAAKGLLIDGDVGDIKKFGADVSYGYSPQDQTLLLTVRSAPHFHDFNAFVLALSREVNGIQA